MNWSERYIAAKYAIANEQEFNQAMGDQFGSMSRAFTNHYANMYAQHVNSIKQLTRGITSTFDPDKADLMREGIDKHERCKNIITNIVDKHDSGEETGDHEDYYNAVANDAFEHSRGILNK